MKTRNFFISFLLLIVTLPAFSQYKILQKDTIVVARDGSGDFRNIQDAVYSIRDFRPAPSVVLIKKGIYKEKLVIPTWKTGITFIGEDRDETIITYDDHANINYMGTFRTHSVIISGNDIVMENLTIENSAPQMGQAVALHAEGDRLIFRNCRFLGNQDTIFTGREGARQYFVDCYIEGTTDFIFGPSTAWFEKCLIHCKRNSYITAASTPILHKYGYIFNNCKVTLADYVTSMYLGRPWRAYGMTLFMNTELPEGIKPEGWHNWGNKDNEQTCRYMEYNNSGAGANVSGRVAWSKVLTKKMAEEYTVANVMRGDDNWNPAK